MVYLTQELNLASTPEQLKILRIAVAERVGGIIGGDDFSERLSLPRDMGGAAYPEDISFLVSRLLEKLIAQGGYIIRANELEGAHT